MASLTIDVQNHPERLYRIDRFSVPAAARPELEAAMHRSLRLLETLPGFLGHVVFVEAVGDTRFDIVTVAMWESAEAADRAGAQMRAYHERIGFDMVAMLARWGVEAERGNFTTPPGLQ